MSHTLQVDKSRYNFGASAFFVLEKEEYHPPQ